MLSVDGLTKSYPSRDRSLTVLDQVSFDIAKGASVAIVGPSGSGKTTLLGLCAGLDRSSGGSVVLNEVALDSLSEDERAAIRNQSLTALENVMVPLELRGDPNANQAATMWLDRVGLAERMNHYPTQLSGGEQQRVAFARAFSNEPQILFADEPTGNLDDETSQKIEQLLFSLNQEVGTTLVLVTHDLELASKTDRIIRLKGGKVVSDKLVSSESLRK
ncbi:UNVERIFIED_CONTAM: hypothetical protein GTU68_036638 [Idotea baltica]|nr:hypothetical protein [Idotea baltica]